MLQKRFSRQDVYLVHLQQAEMAVQEFVENTKRGAGESGNSHGCNEIQF
jgi:hypothetical protein